MILYKNKKGKRNIMADFLHQSQSFDEAKIREDLANLRLELEDEKSLAEELSKDAVSQLESAQLFADQNEDLIQELKAEQDALSMELRSAVLRNKATQAAMAELDDLAKSERFQAIADSIVGIKSKLMADHDFLVTQGVAGRRF